MEKTDTHYVVFNASEFRFSPFLEIILMTQWVNIKGQGYHTVFVNMQTLKRLLIMNVEQ